LWIAGAAGLADFITCDMGGTSTDVCLIENLMASFRQRDRVRGYPIKGREVAINTVGAGGGSVAYRRRRRDAAGRSAQRRRAAWSRVLWPRRRRADGDRRQRRAWQVGTAIARRRDSSRPRAGHRGRAQLGRQLGVATAEEMAEGIVRIAVAQMANAIREISIERGYDPSDFVLFPFGGAGPMHAAQIAAEIGVDEILVPDAAGQPVGVGTARIRPALRARATFMTSCRRSIAQTLARGARRARAPRERALEQRGFARDAMRFRHALDMRYVRQAFELTVELPDGAREPERCARCFSKRTRAISGAPTQRPRSRS
jgi:N-methylhydantoinase A